MKIFIFSLLILSSFSVFSSECHYEASLKQFKLNEDIDFIGKNDIVIYFWDGTRYESGQISTKHLKSFVVDDDFIGRWISFMSGKRLSVALNQAQHLFIIFTVKEGGNLIRRPEYLGGSEFGLSKVIDPDKLNWIDQKYADHTLHYGQFDLTFRFFSDCQ